MEKKLKGQFYTVNSSYILEGLYSQVNNDIVEPFAGRGDLLEWLSEMGNTNRIEAYDIDPKREGIEKRDTLMNPPDYTNKYVITNPPYLARNKSSDKVVFDKYDTNDLYKCFLKTLKGCSGGILIIPAGFFLSPRDLDVKCRDEFLSEYRLIKVKYFEETVFPDTSTTVVAFSFKKAEAVLDEQTVEWISLPSGESKSFRMSRTNDWIVGGEIYKLEVPPSIKVGRYVKDQDLKPGCVMTNMTLSALDSGKKDGRICLEYKEGYVYPAKDCSRTYATLWIKGKTITPDHQKKICLEFNSLLEKKRSETWSLFLPQYRESKEYARKRIPFELAYIIVLHIIHTQLS
jgi:hypothetical protein